MLLSIPVVKLAKKKFQFVCLFLKCWIVVHEIGKIPSKWSFFEFWCWKWVSTSSIRKELVVFTASRERTPHVFHTIGIHAQMSFACRVRSKKSNCNVMMWTFQQLLLINKTFSTITIVCQLPHKTYVFSICLALELCIGSHILSKHSFAQPNWIYNSTELLARFPPATFFSYRIKTKNREQTNAI